MQPKGQFSSGSIAHKASAPTEPQQLSLKSSTAHLRPCSPRDSLAQAEQPMQPKQLSLQSSSAQEGLCTHGASAAQFDELNCSPRALAPKSLNISVRRAQLLNSGHAAHEPVQLRKSSPSGPSGSVRRAQLLNSGHAAHEPVQLRQSSPSGPNGSA